MCGAVCQKKKLGNSHCLFAPQSLGLDQRGAKTRSVVKAVRDGRLLSTARTPTSVPAVGEKKQQNPTEKNILRKGNQITQS